jgi:predicted RecA/RadA family phage recombinase
MKNGVSDGKALALTAPTGGVLSGSAYLIGSLLVVAAADVAQTLTFESEPQGVFDLAKVADEVWTECLKVYWDDTNHVVTLDDNSAANPLVGVAVNPVTTRVVLATDGDDTDITLDNDALTVEVLTYTGLTGKTITVTIGRTDTVLTEGVDFNAETGNNTTATNIAAAIAALDGVDAAAVSAVVTVTPGTGATAFDPSIGRVRLDGAAR